MLKPTFVLAFLLAACSQPVVLPPNGPPPAAGGVTLTAAPLQTTPGSTMALTLANGLDQAIGYNLCTSALLTASGAAVRTDRVCTMELRMLQPGRTEIYNYQLPASLPAGRYRFSTDVERMQSGARTTVTSNTFDVR